MTSRFLHLVLLLVCIVHFSQSGGPRIYRPHRIGIQLDTPPGVHDTPPGVHDTPPDQDGQGKEDGRLPLRPQLPQLNAYSPDARDRAQAQPPPQLDPFPRGEAQPQQPPRERQPHVSPGYRVGGPGSEYVSPQAESRKPQVGLQGGAGPSHRGKPIKPQDRQPQGYSPNAPAYPPPPPQQSLAPVYQPPKQQGGPAQRGYPPPPPQNPNYPPPPPNTKGGSNPYPPQPPHNRYPTPQPDHKAPLPQQPQGSPSLQDIEARVPKAPRPPSKDAPPSIPALGPGAGFPLPFSFPGTIGGKNPASGGGGFPFPTLTFDSPRPFKNRNAAGFPTQVFRGFPNPADAKLTQQVSPITGQKSPALGSGPPPAPASVPAPAPKPAVAATPAKVPGPAVPAYAPRPGYGPAPANVPAPVYGPAPAPAPYGPAPAPAPYGPAPAPRSNAQIQYARPSNVFPPVASNVPAPGPSPFRNSQPQVSFQSAPTGPGYPSANGLGFPQQGGYGARPGQGHYGATGAGGQCFQYTYAAEAYRLSDIAKHYPEAAITKELSTKPYLSPLVGLEVAQEEKRFDPFHRLNDFSNFGFQEKESPKDKYGYLVNAKAFPPGYKDGDFPGDYPTRMRPLDSSCPSQAATLRSFFYHGGECHVVNPAFQQVAYHRCSRRECNFCGVNRGLSACVEIYRWHTVFAYCSKLAEGARIKPLRLILPVGCSCQHFPC